MNQKAFTLFTALVSFILIILVALLLQAMRSTEDSFMDNISDIEERAEMQAVADMARADALQVVNFAIRFGFERWISDNVYQIGPDVESWSDTTNYFAEEYLGAGGDGIQLANRVSAHMSSLVGSTPDVRGYKVSLVESDSELMTQHLQKVIEEGSDTGDFFEVIQCPNGEFNDCLGTFYVNLDMSILSDLEYEELPQIRVENTLTGRVLQEPVLPRGNFRVYVPLRLFKALAGAREMAHTSSQSNADYGLFSARIHNELEEMRLGFCDAGYCNPRTDLYVAPREKDWIGPCPPVPGSTVLVSTRPNRGIFGSESYDPVNSQDISANLKRRAQERVNFIANAIGDGILNRPGSDFLLEGTGTNILNRADVITIATVSKQYVPGIGNTGGTGMPGNYDNVNYEIGNTGAACPMRNGGVGFWRDNGELKWLTGADLICSSWNPGIYCSEITTVKALLVFKETNSKYMVSGQDNTIYQIELNDDHFTRFTPKYSANMGGDCALMNKPQEIAGACSNSIWQCADKGGENVCAPV